MHSRRAAEWVFWTAGAIALGYGGWFYATGAIHQTIGGREFEELRREPQVEGPKEGSVLGRLHLSDGSSAVVFEGTQEDQLAAGIGHAIGTSTTLVEGNIALAAHRDTFFKTLQNIQVGDRLSLDTVQGEAVYRVLWISVVKPSAVDVLRPTSDPSLTLITCYPFEFFGHAPERFIVRATQVSRNVGR